MKTLLNKIKVATLAGTLLASSFLPNFSRDVRAESLNKKSVITEQQSNIPDLILPEEGAIMDNGRTDGRNIKRWEFFWGNVQGNGDYNFRIFDQSGFIMDGTTQVPFITISDSDYIAEENRLNWKWRVRKQIDNVWQPWSEERSFNVESPDTDPISTPDLITPLASATLDNGRTDGTEGIEWDFDWSDVSGAALYTISVRKTQMPSPITIMENITSSEFHYSNPNVHIPVEQINDWQWAIRTSTNEGLQPWSEIRSFNIEPPDTDPNPNINYIPNLISPLENAVLDNGRTDGTDGIEWNFDWSDVPNATNYEIIVRKGSHEQIHETVGTSNYDYSCQPCYFFTGISLEDFAWFWKVRAFSEGDWKTWSEERSFGLERPNFDPNPNASNPEEPPHEPPIIIPEPPIFSPPVVEDSGLVMIIHGLNSSVVGWPNLMSADLRNKIDPSNWNIIPYDWSDNAKVNINVNPLSPLDLEDISKNLIELNAARIRAIEVGKKLGNDLEDYVSGSVDTQYNHFHFIGHSAGAWVINEAAKEIRKANSNTVLHLTFLDPYVPGNVEFQLSNFNGNTRTNIWSDNYFTKDFLPYTQSTLPHSHNVDISDIDPDPNNHSFPHEWYRETIRNPTGTQQAETYGIIRSLEYGGMSKWEDNPTKYPLNNNPVVVKKDSKGILDFFSNITSSTSGINPLQTGLSLVTPLFFPDKKRSLENITTTEILTPNSAWFNSTIDIPQDANYIEFNYQFRGDSPGYFTVYLNDILIFQADQRIHGKEFETTDELPIGDYNFETNRVGVKLTPLENSQTSPSEVYLSNPTFGRIITFQEGDASVSNWQMYE